MEWCLDAKKMFKFMFKISEMSNLCAKPTEKIMPEKNFYYFSLIGPAHMTSLHN